jgi:LmbE family N-acetylglucosaminyl deacetylase
MPRVLAIGAHPDDLEMGCAGTLLKHKHAGDQVTVVITTKGGYGSRDWNTIESEMRHAEEIMGLEYIVLDNPCGHYRTEWKTVSELDRIIVDRKIDTIYTHWSGDSHQDHQVAFKNTLAAARTKRIRSLYCFEIPDYSYRSREVFAARRYVEITQYIDQKLEAIAAYKTYTQEHHLAVTRALAAQRGLTCGFSLFAEAFEVIFETWIDIIYPPTPVRD